MSRAARLQPVSQLAERRVSSAQQGFAAAQEALQQARGQRDELVGYLADYLTPAQGTVGAQMLAARGEFVQKLQVALAQQQDLITQLQAEADGALGELQQAQLRLGGIDRYISECAGKERRMAERRENREINDRPVVRRGF